MVFILFVVILTKWYTTQRNNANNSLNINFIDQFEKNDKISIQILVNMCVECIGDEDADWLSFLDNLPKDFMQALQHIYKEMDSIIYSLEKMDMTAMMIEFDKSASKLDLFLSKADDEVEGVKALDTEGKLDVINTQVIPLFALGYMKVDGVFYDSLNLDKSGMPKPNVVCQETFASNVMSVDILKEVRSASNKIVEKIISISSDPQNKFIFATMMVDPSSNIIVNYLYIDKLKEYALDLFQDMRTFKVSQKMKNEDMSSPLSISCFTWFSQKVLDSGKLILNSETSCPVDEETSNNDNNKIQCSFHLNIFPPGIYSVSFHETYPLFKVIMNDQPFAQLNSYRLFQSYIVDNLFDMLQENSFNVTLSEFIEDIMNGLEKYNKSPLVGNDLRDCFRNILIDTEMKVEMAKSSVSLKDEFITFERFKVKYSSLTCYEASKDFGFNLLLMKSFGSEIKKTFQNRDVYFPNERMNVYIFEKIVIFAILIMGFWYIYFIVGESWKTVKLRHIIKKIEFLLNFGLERKDEDDNTSKNSEEKKNKPPSLHFETRLERGGVILNWLGLKVCLIGFIIVMFFAIMYANSRKYQNVLNYNDNIVSMNTQKILSGVDNALFYISKKDNNNPNAFTFGLHQMNEMVSGSIMTSTEKIRVVEKMLILNKGNMTSPVKLNTDDRDLKSIYDYIVDMLVSYKNENSILLSRTLGLMFPYLDVITNGIMLLIAVGMLMYLVSSLNPFEMVNDAKRFNVAIAGNDVNIIECMLQKEKKFDEINNIIIVACTVIIVIILISMNVSKVISSGSNYAVMLYNSSLYDNRMGYNMKV